jgi:hypothetical protein
MCRRVDFARTMPAFDPKPVGRRTPNSVPPKQIVFSAAADATRAHCAVCTRPGKEHGTVCRHPVTKRTERAAGQRRF